MNVEKLIVGQLRTNCYLVYDANDMSAVVIDPGDDPEYIKGVIEDRGLEPKCIVATHGHFDHVMAALDLKLAYGVEFLMNKQDEFLLEYMKKSAKRYTGIISDPAAKVDRYLEGGYLVNVGKYQLEILDTPGHTPGGVSLYCKEKSICFVGDLIFERGVGRTDFSYSSYEDLNSSIGKISSLPHKTLLYSGHGNKFYVSDLLTANF